MRCGLEQQWRWKSSFLVPVLKVLFKESAWTYRKSNGTSVAKQRGWGRRGWWCSQGFSEWVTEGVTMEIRHPNVAVRDLGNRQREVNYWQVLRLEKLAITIDALHSWTPKFTLLFVRTYFMSWFSVFVVNWPFLETGKWVLTSFDLIKQPNTRWLISVEGLHQALSSAFIRFRHCFQKKIPVFTGIYNCLAFLQAVVCDPGLILDPSVSVHVFTTVLPTHTLPTDAQHPLVCPSQDCHILLLFQKQATNIYNNMHIHILDTKKWFHNTVSVESCHITTVLPQELFFNATGGKNIRF